MFWEVRRVRTNRVGVGVGVGVRVVAKYLYWLEGREREE